MDLIETARDSGYGDASNVFDGDAVPSVADLRETAECETAEFPADVRERAVAAWIDGYQSACAVMLRRWRERYGTESIND